MKRIIGAVISGALFAVLIVLLGIYDVAAIGPAGTEVGFSHINQFVHNLTGVNMIWYDITDFIGYIAIAVCGMFAVAGFVQMIKRRSLLKVDREIWALGGLFIAVIGCYVFFEKYIVNYRPIIMPGETSPEASFSIHKGPLLHYDSGHCRRKTMVRSTLVHRYHRRHTSQRYAAVPVCRRCVGRKEKESRSCSGICLRQQAGIETQK